MRKKIRDKLAEFGITISSQWSWKLSTAFWHYIFPGGIIIVFLLILGKIVNWISNRPLWDFQFLEWFKTATVGEVMALFGGVLLIVRTLTTPSVTIKKDIGKQ